MNKFHGVGVALVTPFTDNGDVDYPALRRLVEFQIENSTDYLVMLGTTSEYVTLSQNEQTEVCRVIKECNNGRLPLVVGIGTNCTSEAIELLNTMDFSGIDALLSVVPYYNKPSQEGIYQHYAAIAKKSTLPIILYNVPGRTAVNMTAKTTLRLQKDFSNIIAIKEASGNINQIDYILRDKREDFMVISGEDNLTLPMIAMGGCGVISVSANCFPNKMSKMTHSALNGDLKTARAIQKELLEATDMLFAEGNPTGAKAALEIKGIIKNNLRLPLIKSTDSLRESLEHQIKKYNL